MLSTSLPHALASSSHSLVLMGIQGGISGKINKSKAYTHVQASPEIPVSSSCQEILNLQMIFVAPLSMDFFSIEGGGLFSLSFPKVEGKENVPMSTALPTSPCSSFHFSSL